MTFSSKTGLLASADGNGAVQLWNVAEGQPIGAPLKTSGDPVQFSPQASLLTADADGYVRDIPQLLPGDSWTADAGQVRSLHGDVVAIPGSSTVQVVTRSGTKLVSAYPGSPVALSPDGGLLPTVSSSNLNFRVQLWRTATGTPVGSPMPVGEHSVASMAFSPDGKLLAVGYDDGTIQLFNPSTNSLVGGPLPTNTASSGSGSPINALTFTPDGSLLLSADDNTDVDPWEVWQYANPYAALCDEAGPPTADVWRQYADGIPEPSGVCHGGPAAAALHG